MKAILLCIVLAAGGLLLPANATAGCTWKWDCTGGYPCKRVPICESAIDIVPIKPPGISPIPPPSVKPIQPPSVPPIGTTSCQTRYICERGSCDWRKVCR